MPRRKRTRFGSGRELREEAQNDSGRSLSAEEWSLVDPGNTYGHDAEYEVADLDDLLELMRSLPGQPSTVTPATAERCCHGQDSAPSRRSPGSRVRTAD